MGCNPILEQLYFFPLILMRAVSQASLTLMLGVNEPLTSSVNVA